MPHKFDLSAFITKTTEEEEENNNNKLVIQLTITDINHIMAYAWNTNETQQQQGSELTWEEQNFMEEEQEKAGTKPDFSEYEWMVNSEEFDSQAMQQIEQDDDDLDDMFYWDPSKGCTKGKSTVKKEQTQTENNNNSCSLFQNFTHHNNQQFQNFQSFQNNNNNQKQQQTSDKNFITNPFSSNFQNNPEMNHQFNQNGLTQNFNNNNNKDQQQKNNNSIPGDDLARAMGGVNLNKFHLNPEATTFVPSWLKK